MSKMPIWQQLAMGGTSVVPAVVLTHPIDVIKLRLQLQGYVGASVGAGAGAGVVQAVQYDGTVSGIARIAREEGMSRLFAGLSPALARAFTFSATRIGLYEPLRAGFSDLAGVTEPTFGVKLAAGLSSGALGAIAGNPFELLKVRMQGHDHSYRNVFHGVVQVCRTEGWRTLWNGTNAAMVRASLFCASQLATYDQTKLLLKQHLGLKDGLQVKFGAAMTAGLITTTVSTPADFVKSIMMNSKARESPGMIIMAVLRRDAGRGFFKGWFANYARLGPHTVITMLTYENLRRSLGWGNL